MGVVFELGLEVDRANENNWGAGIQNLSEQRDRDSMRSSDVVLSEQ